MILKASMENGSSSRGRRSDLGAGFHVDALDRLAIDRRWKKIHDSVEQRLHALVLEGRAAQDWDKGDVADGLADEPLQGRGVRLHAVEIGGHDVVIEFDRRLKENMPVFLGLGLEILRESPHRHIWRRAPRLPKPRLSSGQDR